MTAAEVLIAAVVVVGVAVSTVGKKRSSRQVARDHNRALDTLGQITGQQADAEGSAAGAPERQAHVRVLSDNERPSQLTPLWGPRNTASSAPFKRPSAKGHLWPHEHTGQDDNGDIVQPLPGESVRLIRPDTQPAGTGIPAAEMVAPAADTGTGPAKADTPAPARTGDEAAADQADAPTGEVPVVPPPPRKAPPPAPPDQRVGDKKRTVLRFDDFSHGHAGPGESAADEWRPDVRSGQPPVRSHRRRGSAVRTTAVAAAVVVVVGGLGGAAYEFRSKLHIGGSPTAAPVVTTPPPHHPARKKVRTKPTTPTTVPSPTTTTPSFRLISSSQGVVVYQLSGSAKITLSASAPCWVEIRKGNENGPITYMATMLPGAKHSVTSPAWIRLGSPTGVTISVGGRHLSPPETAGEPVDLVFQ